MKNSINISKIRNGMLLNLSLIIGIAMLSSCAKEQSPSPSGHSFSNASLREPEGDELLLSFAKKSTDRDQQAYSVHVLATGMVFFSGVSGVALIGEEQLQIDRDIAFDIAYEMSNQGFYELKDSEDDGSSNNTVTVLNLDTENEKIVISYGDGSAELATIQEMIIERTGIRELIERQ